MREHRRSVTSYSESENQLADSAEVATVSGRMPMLAAATLSRLVFFTRYIASSARCRRPSLVRESTGYEATPTLGVTHMLTPDCTSHLLSRINLCKRRATLRALSFDVCGSRITNSSPP